MKSFRTPLTLFAIIGTLTTTALIAQGVDLPEAPGKDQVRASCTQCHGVDVIVAQRRTPDEWSQVVSRMVGNGAQLTDDQFQLISAYLAKNLSRPETPPLPAPAANGH
jgi:mono/diheme cytochrome c family protein